MKNARFALDLTFHHPLLLQLATAEERQQPCFPLYPHICQSKGRIVLIQFLTLASCVSSFLLSNTLLLSTAYSFTPWQVWKHFTRLHRETALSLSLANTIRHCKSSCTACSGLHLLPQADLTACLCATTGLKIIVLEDQLSLQSPISL